jgi:hypothetical protein
LLRGSEMTEADLALPFFPPFNAVNADLMQIKAIIPAWAYTLRFRKTSKAIDHAPALHAENCAQSNFNGRRAHWRFGFYYGRFASRRPFAIVE